MDTPANLRNRSTLRHSPFRHWWKLLPLLASLGLASPVVAAPAALDVQINQLQQSISGNAAQIAELERALHDYDVKLQDTRQKVRSERDASYRSLHTARRELTRQKFELERIQQGINLVDQQIGLVKKDTDRSIARFESLNPLKRSLEAGEHNTKLQENNRRIAQLERDKQPLNEKLASARAHFDRLQASVPKEAATEVNVDDHPDMIALLNQRSADMAQLNKLRQQMRIHRATLAQAQEQKRATIARVQAENNARKTTRTVAAAPKVSPATPLTFDPPPAAGIAPGAKAHVFVISGDKVSRIEDVLNLRSWVESYGGRYYEARWNGFTANQNQDTRQFRQEFGEQLRKIPPAARIILIGHGRGGGSAIEAATDVAYTMGRSIDFLAVLDPSGQGDLRANIVFSDGSCSTPEAGSKSAVSAYVNCISSGSKRTITSNVKHFYNRWQKEGEGPADYARSYAVTDAGGKFREAVSATGRFSLADNIQADQKRVFFHNDKDAHVTLLEQESRLLPNLLVKHLR